MTRKKQATLLFCAIALLSVIGLLGYYFWPLLYFHVLYPCRWTFEHTDGRVTTERDDFFQKKSALLLSQQPTGRMVYRITWTGRTVGEYRLIGGKKEGYERWWGGSPERLLTESFYRDGEREGIQKRWWGNGRPMVFEHYQNGKPDGVATSWFETGRISSIRNYSNGLTVGENMDFTPGGKKIAHFWRSTNGVTILSGTSIMSRSEGEPATIGEFTNGVLIRKWKEEWK